MCEHANMLQNCLCKLTTFNVVMPSLLSIDEYGAPPSVWGGDCVRNSQFSCYKSVYTVLWNVLWDLLSVSTIKSNSPHKSMATNFQYGKYQIFPPTIPHSTQGLNQNVWLELDYSTLALLGETKSCVNIATSEDYITNSCDLVWFWFEYIPP